MSHITAMPLKLSKWCYT